MIEWDAGDTGTVSVVVWSCIRSAMFIIEGSCVT